MTDTTNIVDTTASDGYLARVTHVVAYESARLGRESGSITASLVGVILTGRAWELPKSDRLTLDAYVTAGGPEGTYRVARRIAGLIVKPKVPQDGSDVFAKAVIEAHALDTPSLEMAAITEAYLAYKGAQGWQKFTDALAGKADTADTPQKLTEANEAAKKAVEQAMSDGDEASTDKAEAGAEAVASSTNKGIEGIVLAYIQECGMVQLEAVQEAVNKRMIAESVAATPKKAKKAA